MSHFDESKVRRDADGQFASKGPAAEENTVILGQPAGGDDPASLSRSAKEAMAGFDTEPTQPGHSAAWLKGLRGSIQQGLAPDAEATTKQNAFMAACVARRHDVGLDDEKMHAVMRGIAPSMEAGEIEDSYQTYTGNLERSATLLAGDRTFGSDPDDETVLAEYQRKWGQPHPALGEDPGQDTVGASHGWMGRAEHEAERVIACDHERRHPRFTLEAAPRGEGIEQESSLGWNDPDRRARSSERYNLTSHAAEAMYEGRSLDVKAEDVPPDQLTSEWLSATSARADVKSVLIQRGVHPTQAAESATAITRASALASWYEEGGAEAMSAADSHDYDNRNTPGHEKVIGVSADEYADGDWEPEALGNGQYGSNYEVGTDHGRWAEGNAEYWRDRSDELAREALGHPPTYKSFR